MNTLCRSFAPSADAASRVLVLGSMPGAESLRRQEYYAFRFNAFWPIMGELFGFDPALGYAERLALLRRRGVALWDVCAVCERPGSLDSGIRNEIPNPVDALLAEHPAIRTILCNGTTAARLFHRHFGKFEKKITVMTLPSTSPAAAGIARAEKLALWHRALIAGGVL